MFGKVAGRLINTLKRKVIWIGLLLFLMSNKVYAQSLGDPIVNITFGSGTNRSSGALAADSGSTTYLYSAAFPNDGYYTIVNSTIGLNRGWWTTSDHTGNPGGYMMVVNGSYDPGIFYTRTVGGLCGNTTYQFAAWIKNLLNYNGILPNVSFSIETTGGTVLVSGTTGNIPEANVWMQYPFTFTTPVGTESVVIKMTNNAPGGIGNDIAIDDITFRPYGAPVQAAFNQSAMDMATCAGTPQNININAATTLATGYLQKLQLLVKGVWTDQSPAGTSSVYTFSSPSNAGSYYYRLVSAQANNIGSSNCVVASNTLTLTVLALPTVVFSTAGATCVGDSTYFKDQSVSNGSTLTNWLWDFGDGQTSALRNPAHKYARAEVYPVSLTVTSAIGCSAAATKSFTVNGAAPVASFTVLNSGGLCSNQEVFFTNQATVDFGSITKVQWFFDYGNNPTVSETDINPAYGKTYRHTYTPFYTPASQNYQVRMLAYSGSSCVSEVVKTITLLATPQLTFPVPSGICLDAKPVQLTAGERNGTAGTGVYAGTGVSASGLFNPAVAGAGTFAVRYIFASANTCADTISQNITVSPLPQVSAGADMVVLEGGNTKLKATASGDSLTYAWSPAAGLSSTTILNPVVTPTSDLTYTLTVTSSKGCSASSRVLVSVLKAPVVPNTFTPNGDGINDTWNIKYLNTYADGTVEVFNRYGNKVYFSVGYPVPWDGRFKGIDLPVSTYYYIINPKQGRKILSGWVTIIR
ncbi:MAG: gliding motility-associated C-terminal domain-containing protein [Mucilaginibacter sp.]|uniref:T9SS type B sorting domain-containing protein n=1 Tax=Mucilaginibacter sp. TaxID=1882438 RepID=UPI0034E3A3A6